MRLMKNDCTNYLNMGKAFCQALSKQPLLPWQAPPEEDHQRFTIGKSLLQNSCLSFKSFLGHGGIVIFN
jgi:hypothetical protein